MALKGIRSNGYIYLRQFFFLQKTKHVGGFSLSLIPMPLAACLVHGPILPGNKWQQKSICLVS